MSETITGQPGADVHFFFAEFPPGTPVTFLPHAGGSESLFLGGIIFGNRPPEFPPGSSSPQWVQKIVVGTDKQKMIDGVGVDAVLGQPRVTLTSCTSSSKKVQFFRIDAQGAIKFLANVEVLGTQGCYDLNKPQPTHVLLGLTVSEDAIDPNPGSPVAAPLVATWRTMSALSEALFLNFPHP